MKETIIIAQLIGIVAIVIYSLSPHQKTNAKVLIYRFVAAILYAIQYFLLGAYTAVLTNIIGGVKEGLFYLYSSKDKKIPFMLFLAYALILIVSGIFTYVNLFSILPVIFSVLTAYATWCGNLKNYRILLVLSSLSWLVYNFTVGAYISFVGNIFQLSSTIFSMLRFDFGKKKVDNN